MTACLAGSLAAHALGYSWMVSRRSPIVRNRGDDFVLVEPWPTYGPPPPPAAAASPAREAGATRGDPAPGGARSARAAGVPAPDLRRKGILGALATLDRGSLSKGLPGPLDDANDPTGLPDAPRAEPDPGAVPGRKGGARGAPAMLGDLGTGGGSGRGGSGGLGGALGDLASVGFGTSQVVSDEVSQARLDAFVRARIGALRACYETQLRAGSLRDGTLRVRFSILATGDLDDVATVQDTLGSAAVERCVIDVVRAWRTPFRPSRPVGVEYPFVFRPSRE